MGVYSFRCRGGFFRIFFLENILEFDVLESGIMDVVIVVSREWFFGGLVFLLDGSF